MTSIPYEGVEGYWIGVKATVLLKWQLGKEIYLSYLSIIK
jgi:hypothetical protein